MKIYTADNTPLNIFRIAITLITVALLILCKLFIPFHILMITLMWVFSISAIIVIFFYLPTMFRNIEIHVEDNAIRKKNGVFFRREQTIKISSVQYVTTAVCVFSKINGFDFIVLNIYGGFMILPFLSHKDFNEIMMCINNNSDRGK